MSKEGFDRKQKELIPEEINGVSNTILNESVPNYNISESEKTIEGKNNTSIVFGRDRPSTINSGYGGVGFKKSGAIDIVVGRTSAIIQEFDSDGNKVYTDPSIPYDASRITISQKTDIDDNFYLPGFNVKGKAGIAIKSDNIRVVAREGVKIVTNSDKYDSNGDLKVKKYGVQLISGDGQELQPIPKGKNLEEVIKDLYQKISEVQIANIYKILLSILESLTLHTHEGLGGPTSPSPELIASIPVAISQVSMSAVENQLQQLNVEKSKLTYLTPGSKKYINSLLHEVD
jgi:hypothetical protein